MSRSFALDVVACAALAIMFWVACAGIGSLILPKPAQPPDGAFADDETAPPSWRQPGVAAVVGLAALLLFGGFGVLLRIPWWLIVGPFLVIGLVLALRTAAGVGTHFPKRVAVFGLLAVIAFAFVALVEAPLGLRFRLNVCDDWRAYLPYARRLLATNGLEEPWSARRVQSLGGFDLLRALPVAVFGNAGVGVAETVLASVFLAGLFVANGMRSTWARVVTVVIILAVPLLWVPRANTTGVLMGTPLLVAVSACTVELRASLRAGGQAAVIRWAVAAGFVTSALVSVRPNLGLLGAIVLTLGALTATGSSPVTRFKALAAGAASGLLAFAPWSIAMWRTAGTPLYPLFTGHLNDSALAHHHLDGLGDLTTRTWDLVRTGPYLSVTIGVIVVAFLARRLLPDAAFVAIAALASVAVTIVFAINTPFLPWTTFSRYIAPMSGGIAVFLLCEMLRAADVLPAPSQHATRAAGAAVVVAAIAAIAFSGIGAAKAPFTSAARLLLESAQHQPKSTPERRTSTRALRHDFARAFRGVGAGRTIASVDRPYLIDYSRYDVTNLDAPGFLTADGGPFPFFTGPGPKIARLRGAGYRTLVATDPIADICLAPVRMRKAIRRNGSVTAVYSRFLDWDDDIEAIVSRAPGAVRRVGSLLVIDLPRAQRALEATTS